MPRDVLKRLNDATLAAVRIAGRDWPRGLLVETPVPDAWMGLARKREGRRWFVAAGDFPRISEDDELVLLRNRAFTVPVQLRDQTASCGNQVHAAAELLVRWEARESELAAFAQTFLTTAELMLDQLAEQIVDGGGSTGLRHFIRTQSAERLVGEDCRPELLAAFQEGLKRLAFEGGFVVERVAKFTAESPTLLRSRERERENVRRQDDVKARELIEKAAVEAAGRRLDELSGLLEKLKATAARDGGSRWSGLLPTLSPAERGRLLENLWRLTPNARVAYAIVVVAGNECVWLDPAAPETVLRRVAVPADFGGLRSVGWVMPGPRSEPSADGTSDPRAEASGRLMIGAASGVWMLDAETGAVLAAYKADSPQRPRTGFNASVVAGDTLYATHSQLGCWAWPVKDPAGGRAILAPNGGVPKAIRSVATADGLVYLAADDCVHVFDPDTAELRVQSTAGDVIHCLALDGQTLYVGTERGRLLRQESGQPDDWFAPFHTSGPLESVAVRRWGDLVELVVPAGPQGIDAVYEEQNVVVRLVETGQSIRKAWACDDLVIGLNDRRDRLVVCRAAQPDRRGCEAAVSRLMGASIQDVCIVTHSAAG